MNSVPLISVFPVPILTHLGQGCIQLKFTYRFLVYGVFASLFFLFKFFFGIGVYLIYNVVLVSGVQQCICIHIYLFCFRFFSHTSYYKPLIRV